MVTQTSNSKWDFDILANIFPSSFYVRDIILNSPKLQTHSRFSVDIAHYSHIMWLLPISNIYVSYTSSMRVVFRNRSYSCFSSSKSFLCIITFIISWGKHIYNISITLATSALYMISYHKLYSLISVFLLTLWRKKKRCLSLWFLLPFIEIKCNPLLVQCHIFPKWPVTN
jgi:hypothetical protein